MIKDLLRESCNVMQYPWWETSRIFGLNVFIDNSIDDLVDVFHKLDTLLLILLHFL